MKISLVLPILIPLLTGIACILAGASRAAQRWLSVLGAGALMAAGIWLLRDVYADGIQAVQLGSWPAPFGITLVADLFSAIMVVVTGFVGLCVGIFALANIDRDREHFGFHPLYHFLLMGVCGAFLTGDLFNLFVWFEVMLMASFVLLALGGERPQIEGAVKYLTLNFIASAVFLTALGVLYGKTGTLNMADLAVKLSGQPSGVALSSALLLLVAFGIKAGLFPLFFWLPASYHTRPVAVSAVFAGLLTKVGVYALIRVFTLIFTADTATTHGLIVIVLVLTMITGVLGAAAQYEIRRLLAFHIISQIGYITLGLGLFTPAAIAASIFYLVHNIMAKTNLFLIGGAIGHVRGTGQLKQLGGLYRDYPWLALLLENVRADHVANGDVALAGERGLDADDQLRRARPKGDDREPHYQRREPEPQGQRGAAAHQPFPAEKEQDETEQEEEEWRSHEKMRGGFTVGKARAACRCPSPRAASTGR